jgi:hypothetical protein
MAEWARPVFVCAMMDLNMFHPALAQYGSAVIL